MTITKTIAIWLWTQIRKELTIQQPGPEYYAARRNYEPTPGRRVDKRFTFAKLLAVIIAVPFVLIFLLPLLAFII